MLVRERHGSPRSTQIEAKKDGSFPADEPAQGQGADQGGPTRLGLQPAVQDDPLLLEALRRDPTNPDILLKLATACGKQRHYEKAEEYLARVLELAPRKATIYRRVAQTYAMIDRPERAVECYRRSLELNRDTSVTVPTLLELARLYERRHQLDDARAVVDEALQRDPGHEEAQLQQAILDRRRGKTAEAESKLRTLGGRSNRGRWPTRAQASYELAQLLDDQSGTTKRLPHWWRRSDSCSPPPLPIASRTRRH